MTDLPAPGVPSDESKRLATELVRQAVKDGLFGPSPHEDVIAARVAAALEASWQQGLSDAEVWARVAKLKGVQR